MLGRGACWQLTPQWSKIEDVIGVWGGNTTVFESKGWKSSFEWISLRFWSSKVKQWPSCRYNEYETITWKFPFIHQMGFQYTAPTALMWAMLKASLGFHFPCYAMLLSSLSAHRRDRGINYYFAEGLQSSWMTRFADRRDWRGECSDNSVNEWIQLMFS